MTIQWMIIEFFCGAFMFSYWLGLAVKKDLNTVGDGNPGAFNLWHAAGCKLGLLGVLLDFLKGYFPLVFLLHRGLVPEQGIVFIALAPILGHAFSPFLRGKGGKAIAVSFGVWSALTRFEASFAYALILAVLQVIAKARQKGKACSTEADALMSILGMWILGFYLFVRGFSVYIILIWAGNLFVFIYKNYEKLAILYKKAFWTTFRDP